MSQKLTTTAVITCYESSSTIGLTLMSLVGQTHLPEEIIVTDDGSSAETCSYIKGLLATIENAADVRTEFLTHPRTTPYRLNTIRNAGIRQASGQLILLLDGDILVPRDFLREHLDVHQAMMNDGISVLVSCVRKNISSSGEVQDSRKSEWGRELDRYLLSQPWSKLDLEPEQSLSQSTFLREDWIRVGQFDTDFDGHWGFDEIEFAYRMKKNGVRLTCHGTVFHIDEGPGAGSRDETRNRQLYLQKKAGA